MTVADFLAFYPQFTGFQPEGMLTAFAELANARFDAFGADAEDARRLYTAHRLTLYARTALPEGAEPSLALLAAAGEKREIASKKVGEVAVTYATSSSSAGGRSASWADLPQTDYGLQLLSLLRLHAGSVYVP